MTCDELRRVMRHRGQPERYRAMEERLCGETGGQSKPAKLLPPPIPPFYGNALKALLAEYGAEAWKGCNCADRIRLMNTWTAAEVRASRETVAGWLAVAAGKAALKGHWSALFAGGKMAGEEWFDPKHPFISIVSESIRRAEAQEKQS